jgi:STAS domain-containing protein
MGTPPPGPIVVDVSGLAPDAAAVDVLARLRLAARRLGSEIRFRRASSELVELVVFAGLEEVLHVEARREPEQREERLGVEEEGELGDPSV